MSDVSDRSSTNLDVRQIEMSRLTVNPTYFETKDISDTMVAVKTRIRTLTINNAPCARFIPSPIPHDHKVPYPCNPLLRMLQYWMHIMKAATSKNFRVMYFTVRELLIHLVLIHVKFACYTVMDSCIEISCKRPRVLGPTCFDNTCNYAHIRAPAFVSIDLSLVETTFE